MNIDFGHKAVVVTGATSGIGLQTALDFIRRGATVIGVGRSQERCQAAERLIRAESPQACIQYLVTDLSTQSQVRRLASEIQGALERAGFSHLDVLVNNAGLYSSKYIRTVDDIELTLAVNHLAPFLLTHELLPWLLRAPSGRVITVSSMSHRGTSLNLRRLGEPFVYIGIWAYKESKLANILFTLELKRRVAGTRLQAFAVDPGLVNTSIGSKGQGWFSRLFWENRRKSGTDPEVPACTILYLAGEENLPGPEALYWRDCQPATPSRTASRPDLARRLWQRSCRLCGILDLEEER